MCPNFGTPKINKFFILEQMENLLYLGVAILKHITVYYSAITLGSPVPFINKSSRLSEMCSSAIRFFHFEK